MLKILKFFENFENYDARQMRVISSGKCHVISHKKFKVTYWAVCGQLI